MHELEGLVGDLGFPIAVTGYLLFRLDGLVRKLTESVQELVDELKHSNGHSGTAKLSLWL